MHHRSSCNLTALLYLEFFSLTVSSNLSCVDPDHFYDHTIWTQQEQVNHLFCPLDNQSLQLLQSTSNFSIQWSKNCHLLNFTALSHLHSTLQNTTTYLTFEHANASDAGNYTCTLYLNDQRNSSFTVRLVMAGEWKSPLGPIPGEAVLLLFQDGPLVCLSLDPMLLIRHRAAVKYHVGHDFVRFHLNIRYWSYSNKLWH